MFGLRENRQKQRADELAKMLREYEARDKDIQQKEEYLDGLIRENEALRKMYRDGIKDNKKIIEECKQALKDVKRVKDKLFEFNKKAGTNI